jgi:hypothetical protein
MAWVLGLRFSASVDRSNRQNAREHDRQQNEGQDGNDRLLSHHSPSAVKDADGNQARALYGLAIPDTG